MNKETLDLIKAARDLTCFIPKSWPMPLGYDIMEARLINAIDAIKDTETATEKTVSACIEKIDKALAGDM